MIIKKTKVTPQKAAQWLEKNFGRNRKIRKGHISKLVFDMKNGNWQETGETLKFNIMGDLIDGQHRLTAIVESGCTLELWVATDVPNAAINAIDIVHAPERADEAATENQDKLRHKGLERLAAERGRSGPENTDRR